jgi:WD40 repeat protein
MTEPLEPTLPADITLSGVIADYLLAVDAGRAPDRDELLTRHPHLAAELRAFFADQDALERVAEPLRADAAPPPEPAPPLGIDETVTYMGDYELRGELGRGGMGVVYRARQVSLNRPVALKMILAGQFASAEDVRRFRTEAENVANLDHPNIVPIYEVGEHQGQQYFSMKLIEGGSLATRMTEVGGDQRRAVQLLATAARAVHHAHQRGILHRDLKPGNLLLDAAGTVYVTDFGLAKRLTEDVRLSRSGAIIGTPGYLSPEQAAGRKDLSVAADVYGLGAILFELLTGRTPFVGDNPLDVLVQVLEKEPPRPRSFNRKIGGDLETICLKCLDKEPEQRYASAEALADDLEHWLQGEPIQARPVGRRERAWKWVRRRPAAAALLGVSVLAAVVLVILGIGSRFYSQLRTAYEETEKQRQLAVEAWEGEEREKKKVEEERDKTRFQKQRAEMARHALQMDLAYRAWQAQDLVRVTQILDEVPEELRTAWEYRYLRSKVWNVQTAQEVHFLKENTSGVWCVAFSPDGQRLATARGDLLLARPPRPPGSAPSGLDAQAREGPRVTVSDVRTGQEILALSGHKERVTSVAFSPDGKRLASGEWNRGGEGEVKVWDTQTRQQLLAVKGAAYGPVAFSPDGKRLAGSSLYHRPTSSGNPYNYEPGVKVWDAQSRQEVLAPGPTGLVTCVAFSPDGKRIASGDINGKVRVWDARTGQQLLDLQGHRGQVLSVAFSPDGKRIASGSGVFPPTPGELKVWDAQSGQQLFDLKGAGGSLAFSPDGQRLASACVEGSVRLWDPQTGQEVLTLPGPTGGATAVCFSTDGRRLATASTYQEGKEWRGEVKVWDADPSGDHAKAAR